MANYGAGHYNNSSKKKKEYSNRYTLRWGDETFTVTANDYNAAIEQAINVLVVMGYRKSTLVAADFEMIKSEHIAFEKSLIFL